MKITLALTAFLLALNTPNNAAEPVNGLPTTEQISEFTTTGNDQELAKHLLAITRGQQSPRNSLELLSLIVAQADKYLTDHPKPNGTPSRNIAPPNGGISGSDPESIADPAQRAAYKKLLDDNNSLAEAHRKHSAVLKIRDSAVELLAAYRVNGSIDESQVRDAFNRHGITEAQKVALAQLVKAATANKAQHPTDGAAEPKEPK